MPPPLRIGTVYDFRNTPESGMDMPSLYAAIMDQVVMLDPRLAEVRLAGADRGP